MASYSEMLDSILDRSNAAAVRKLRAQLSDTFSSNEVFEIEKVVVTGAAPGKIDKLLPIVWAKIAALDPGAGNSLGANTSHHYPKYHNILDADFPAAEKALAAAESWLTQAARSGRQSLPSATLMAARLAVTAIIEMQILSVKAIKGLLESVREERVMEFATGLVSIPFEVVMRRGWPAQEGWANLEGCGRTVLNKIERQRKSPEWNTAFEKLCTLEPDKMIAEMDAAIAAGCPSDHAFTIDDLVDAACVMAIEHMPSAVRAVRCGVAISYAPELAAARRLTGKRLKPYPESDTPTRELDAEDDGNEDDGDGEPDQDWERMLRATVKKSGVDQGKLKELAELEEQAAKTMAKFVVRILHLKASTIYTYTWKIANKLMPILGKQDPGELTLDEWEDLAQAVLDEEAFYHQRIYSGPQDRDAAGYARGLIKALRSFVRCFWSGKDEQKEFNAALPSSGYVRVIPDMITVDEFRRALNRLHSWRVDGKKSYLIRAARVALILGFRLGLRIAELAYLRVSDFDLADEGGDLVLANLHLRVRPWLLRKLKTANADRDLPISVLIPRDELEEVMDFVLDSLRLGCKGAPLFGRERSRGKVMKFPRVIEILKKVFNGKGRECIHRNFHFHLLRHSAANLWLLKLWPGLHEVANQVFKDHHPKTLEEIRDTEKFRFDLMGTTEIRGEDIQICALLLGHGSGAVSMHHYLHVLWWWTGVKKSSEAR